MQANRGSNPNCLRAPNGELWFTVGDYVLIVNPSARPLNQTAPPVFIESMRVDDQDRLMGSTAASPLKLLPGHKKLEFHYTALSFTSPENVVFRYQLEGMD